MTYLLYPYCKIDGNPVSPFQLAAMAGPQRKLDALQMDLGHGS